MNCKSDSLLVYAALLHGFEASVVSERRRDLHHDVRSLNKDGTGEVPEAAGASSMMSCRGGSGGGDGSAMVEIIETMVL